MFKTLGIIRKRLRASSLSVEPWLFTCAEVGEILERAHLPKPSLQPETHADTAVQQITAFEDFLTLKHMRNESIVVNWALSREYFLLFTARSAASMLVT